MALRWDLTRITDQSVCWQGAGDDAPLSHITEHLIWTTLTVGLSEITEANWEEFYAREVMQWHVYGGLKLAPQDVRAHIGLRTNASPITKAAFNASVIKHLRREATDRIKLSTVSLVKPAEATT